MQAFKIGDIVTCVDNEDMEHRIYVGASYTVLGVSLNGDLVALEGFNNDGNMFCSLEGFNDDGNMFCSSRFVLGSKPLSLFQQWEKSYV